MRRKLLLGLLPLALAGCDFWYNTVPSPDQIWYRISWFDHMIYSPAVNPYSRLDVPRTTVKGTVPVGGGEADWETGDGANLAYAFDQAAADRLVNPTTTGSGMPVPGPAMPMLPPSAERGDSLYGTYCATCHGMSGAGNGLVASRFVGVPSILTDRARAYTDGYLYSIVRYGRGLMPKYGDKLPNQTDRWLIVNHVRALQARSATSGATGGAN
jgi:mono/diheme cytochrome c family protein